MSNSLWNKAMLNPRSARTQITKVLWANIGAARFPVPGTVPI